MQTASHMATKVRGWTSFPSTAMAHQDAVLIAGVRLQVGTAHLGAAANVKARACGVCFSRIGYEKN